MAQGKAEGKKHDHTFRDFGGVNTQAARQAIEDTEFAWLENIMPLGHGNLVSVPYYTDTGVVLAATCYWMKAANLNNIDYMMMFCSDGSAYQVNLTSGYAVTTIGALGTFNGSGTQFDQWANTKIIIADPTKGTFSWDGTTLVSLSAIFAITASIAATTMTVTATAGALAVGQLITAAGVAGNTFITGFVGGSGGTGTYTINNTQSVASEGMTATPTAPATGTCVAVYAGRVWIANGRTIQYSAPNSYTDFTTTDFGGSFIVQDSTLHSVITQLVSTSGFLYIIGYDSINVISDVAINTTLAATVFSNLNLVTTAGTAAPSSVVSFYRTLWMATPYGFYGVTGATAQKGSDKLDGIFRLLANASSINGGVAVINKVLCLCFLVSYNDPVLGNRPLLAIFFNKKWFFASQGNDIHFCANASILGTQTMFATTGTHLLKLFSDTTSNISQIVKTKLWCFGEADIQDVQVLKAGVECVMPATAGLVDITIDSESSSSFVPINGSNEATWYNNAGIAVTWINNTPATALWFNTGFVWFHGDASNFGKYSGITVTTAVPGIELSAVQIQYELRARW
jgi:hypothetical protein